MARSKANAAPKKAGIITDPKNPQTWLYLNPIRRDPGMVFGVLRKHYGDRLNSAAAFGARKLCPVGFEDIARPSITAARYDVVLPEHAADELADPFDLLSAMDQTALEKALLVYTTIAFPEVARLHQAFEQARGFASKLARERQLASLVVLHAPGLVSSASPVHAHLLIAPRAIGPLGLRHGIYDHELTRDTGQEALARLWREYLEESG